MNFLSLSSLSDKVELHEPSCALFDGETVLLQNCSSGNESGYICKKDFGRFFKEKVLLPY
jgi:hypothetical protein